MCFDISSNIYFNKAVEMINEVTIRDIRPEDFSLLVYLIEELGYPPVPEKVVNRLQNITNDNSYKTLVAEVNGKVIGFISLCKLYAYEENGCYIRIVALVVDKQYRGYGVGTKLVNTAETWASSIGAFAIVLDSGINRKEAHTFYNNRGYKVKDYGFAKSLQQF